MRELAHRLFRLLAGAIREYSAIWLFACVGLALSLLTFGILRRQLASHAQAEFEWAGRNRSHALENGIRRSLEAVRTLADLVRFRADLDGEEFRSMAETVRGRATGVQALLWAPRVVGGDSARELVQGAPSGALEPAASGDEHIPVRFLYAPAGGGPPVGLDLMSEEALGDTLERARRSGTTSVSGRVRMEGERFGFFAAQPVTRRPSPDAGPVAVTGFVVGSFVLADLAAAAIDPLEPRGMDCLIRDESSSDGEQVLHIYASRLGAATRPLDEAAWSAQADTRPVFKETFRVADREWSVTNAPTPSFRSAEAFRSSPWIALLTGVFVTLLISAFLVRQRQHMLHRLRVERTLRDREELFWQMTETVSEVFWATTPDRSAFLYVSPAFEQIWGVPCDELYRSPRRFEELIHAEERGVWTEALEKMRRTRSPVQVVFRLRRADGSIRWIRDRGFPVLDDAGEIVRIVGFAEDVTDERLAHDALTNSEKRLRELFNQSPDIILTVNREGRVLFVNRPTPELSADFAINSDSAMVVPEDERDVYRTVLDRSFETGEIEHVEFETNGGACWELRLVPLVRGRATVAVMVILADVTENRKLQDHAARNARLASIGVLAAGVAHEVNNPNSAILFNANLLARAWNDVAPILDEYHDENGDFSLAGLPYAEASETVPELLSQIGTNAQRIRRIVASLKHLSRRDPDELQSEVDVRAVLEAAEEVLRNQTMEKTDRFELSVAPGLPAVRGSAQHLEQVFINVIMNALQALPDRDRGVFVTATADPGGSSISVCVRDEGEGIAPELLQSLTEPFVSTREDSGGMGLGLSISQSIVDRHGGRISFESKRGEGTKVTITLPVAPGEA